MAASRRPLERIGEVVKKAKKILFTKPGQKVFTDFICSSKTTKISCMYERTVIVDLKEKELVKFMVWCKKRMKSCKEFRGYFIHLSPDVSFFIKKGKGK